MPERPNTVAGLVAKRDEITGKMHKLQKELTQLTAAREHVDAVIRLFDPEMDFGELRPAGKPHRAIRQGPTSRLVISLLRTATDPLDRSQIATGCMVARGLDPDDKALFDLMLGRIDSALWRLETQGRVLRTRIGKAASLWAIAPPG